MTYQLRFESNAFEADSMIGQALDKLVALSRTMQKMAGTKARAEEVNKMLVLRGICLRTFEEAMDWADADFDQQMVDIKWDWPNNTRRKNGEIAKTRRDIVDTGALMQSKKRKKISADVTEFIWQDEVAIGVHDGMKTKSGKDLPARPWTEPTLADIDEVINSLINRRGR